MPVLACQAWRRAQRLLDAPLLRAALGASGAARNAVVSRLAKGGEWRRALQGLDAKDALQPDEAGWRGRCFMDWRFSLGWEGGVRQGGGGLWPVEWADVRIGLGG